MKHEMMRDWNHLSLVIFFCLWLSVSEMHILLWLLDLVLKKFVVIDLTCDRLGVASSVVGSGISLFVDKKGEE